MKYRPDLEQRTIPTYEQLKNGLLGLIEQGKISREDAAMLFPELAESEDEGIRKSIADCVSLMGEDDDVFSNHNVTKVQVLAWLKKQKESNESHEGKDEGVRKEMIDFLADCTNKHRILVPARFFFGSKSKNFLL